LNAQQERGRWVFLLVAAPIALVNLGSAVVHYAESGQWNRVLGPAVLAGLLVWAWTGDRWITRFAAAACVIAGFPLLLMGMILPLRLAAITPSNSTQTFWLFAGPLLAIGLWGAYHILAAAMIQFSPSVQAFFARQRVMFGTEES
jgi:hypothetical protein